MFKKKKKCVFCDTSTKQNRKAISAEDSAALAPGIFPVDPLSVEGRSLDRSLASAKGTEGVGSKFRSGFLLFVLTCLKPALVLICHFLWPFWLFEVLSCSSVLLKSVALWLCWLASSVSSSFRRQWCGFADGFMSL